MTPGTGPDAAGLTAEEHPFFAEVYYGPWSTASPLLSFACLRGAGGVFVSLNTDGRVRVCVTSDAPEALRATYQVSWGQDEVAVPRAFLVSPEAAEHIVRHFCATGAPTPDTPWRD